MKYRMLKVIFKRMGWRKLSVFVSLIGVVGFFGFGSALAKIQPSATVEKIGSSTTVTGPMEKALREVAANQRHSALDAKISTAVKTRVQKEYGKLPLTFEVNQGQTDAQVKFLSRGHGYTLFLTPKEAVLVLRKPQKESKVLSEKERETINTIDENPIASVLRMKLVDANPNPKVTGLEKQIGKSNYFVGKDPKKWRTNISHFSKVAYHEVYPGIDLVYYGNQQQLEYDFIVSPGADPKMINLALEGVGKLWIDAQGDLVIETLGGEIRQHKPIIYQEVNSLRKEISGHYVLKGKDQLGFQVAAYDTRKPLIIDPVLVYSTYLGGSGRDRGFDIAVDNAGNTYIAGETASINFPTASPLQGGFAGLIDIFISKLDATGSGLVYSTYLGGSSLESAPSIAVDSGGAAYITGFTASLDFPTVSPLQASNAGGSDVFVSKLDATGSTLVFSTYLGGSQQDFGHDITLDNVENIYVVGDTQSLDFPTASPFQPALSGSFLTDAFVSKIDPTGSALIYSTYYGGLGFDNAFGIAVDSSGNAYVAGRTDANDFPTVSPLQSTKGGGFDAFVGKINPTGGLVWSTYHGGSGSDDARNIALDVAGNVYITGRTTSIDFPIVSALKSTLSGDEAFVSKIDSTGGTLVYSTFFGGSSNDEGNDITLDSAGNIYLTGFTRSTDFPTVLPIQANLAGGPFDAFASKIDTTGSVILFSTYLGGSFNDFGNGIAVDSAGDIYVVGYTESLDFPTTSALQGNHAGGVDDAFVVKIGEVQVTTPVDIDIKPGSFPNSINLGSNGNVPVAIFSTTIFDATTVDPTTVTLANASVKLKGKGTPMASFEDVDGDGLLDLVVHVETSALTLTETDTEAVLAGETFGGDSINGVDTVRIVP